MDESLVTTDLSLMGLFSEADLVVKLVMLGLMIASVISWAIIFEKLILIKLVNRNAIKFYRDFWSSNINDIDAAYRNSRNNPMAKIFNAGIKEWNTTFKIHKNMSIDGVKGRIEKAMNVQMNIELDKLEKKLLFLASVGSTAPFIGLFGTVYGIMNSFSAIATSKSTNLTVVAPGIAEALFATAIGLFAAIPAVMFYNKISSDIIPVAIKAIEYYLELNDEKAAFLILKKSWKNLQYTKMIDIFMNKNNTSNKISLRRFKLVFKALKSAIEYDETKLAMAVASFNTSLWAETKKYLELIKKDKWDKRVIDLWKLLSLETKKIEIPDFPEKIKDEPKWKCSNCGYETFEWNISCDNCDDIGKIVWPKSRIQYEKKSFIEIN